MSVFKDLKTYKGLIGIVLLLTFLNTIGELLLPFLMSMIVDYGIQNQNIPYILRIGGVMLLVAFLTILVRGAAAYFSAKTSMAFSRDLRKRMFSKVNNMTFDETEKFGISSLITRTTNDVSQVEQLILMTLRPLVRAPLTFIGALIMALLTDVRLTLIIVIVLPILFGLLAFVIKVIVPYFPILQKSLDRINLLLRQRLIGLKVIRAFNQDEKEEEIFDQANQKYYQTNLKVNQIIQTINPVLVLTLNLSIVAVAFIGAQFIDNNTLEIGSLMAFIQYITQALTAIIIVTRMMTFLPRSSASIERIQKVVDYPTRNTGGDLALDGKIKEIKAVNLGFKYPGASHSALEKINFTVSTGESLGIIGGTGSGKTTLLKLLMQFYDPSEGELLLNGKAIQELKTFDLREEISYVPQQNYFFSESIRENFQYANNQANDNLMMASIDTAQAREFLPQDSPLDEMLSRGGGNYSGGQKQRLAISRALIRDASVFVFDDSFSALDYKTDRDLRNALRNDLTDSITIIVAQRVASIRHADQILVLEEGKMQGIGSHDQLIETNEVYRDIVESQGEEERKEADYTGGDYSG